MGIFDRFARRAGSDTTTVLTRPRPESPPPVKVADDVGTYGSSATIAGSSSSVKDPADRLVNATKLTPPLVAAMREHYQVSACLLVQTLPLVRAGWVIECDDDDIREHVETWLGSIMRELMRSLARSMWAGYSPNVLVWNVDPATGGLYVSNVRDLDPFTCKPMTDAAGRYIGMVQHKGTKDEVRIDALQTLWGVEGLESGNLYGRSILTAAREPWQRQRLLETWHSRHLERFGEPIVRVRHPEGTYVVNQAEITAAVAAGQEPPDPIIADKADEAIKLGEGLRNHTVAALPSDRAVTADGKDVGYAWDLDFLEASRDGSQAFADKIAEEDRRIARAIFVPDLLLSNTEAGSYSLGKEHRSMWTDSVESRLAEYAGQITRHVVDRLVDFNFGESAPRARLSFEPQTDESRDELWTLVQTLVAGGRLPVDVLRIADRVGLPLAADAAEQVEAADEEDPTPDDAPAVEPDAELDRARPVIYLAGGAPADTSGMPEWKRPQAGNATGTGYRREFTAREKRADLAKVERDLNRVEAAAIAQLEELLEGSREKVLRQVQGIMRKGGDAAEVIKALRTINVGGAGPWAAAWASLQRDVWAIGLESVAREVTAQAALIPTTIGRAGSALITAHAETNAERALTELATRVRLEAIAALTSGVSPAGMVAAVSSIYDAEVRGENKPPRLTTRMLSSQALNRSRADAIERGGIRLKGAQYSAILDRVTCDLCERLDGQQVAVTHPDFERFTAPLHHNCRCVWVYVEEGEEEWEPTWVGAPEGMVGQYGSLIY